MKASEITNTILADECESVAESMEKYGGKGCGAKLREAAARLRKVENDKESLIRKTCDIAIAGMKNKIKEILSELEVKTAALQISNGMNEVAARREITLCSKLKVAEDALEKLQDRFVSSVHDGTIDPHEALEIAENALAEIREEGCDPCNANVRHVCAR